MSSLSKKSEKIQALILNRVEEHPIDISKITAKRFGITRQAVNKHLQKLLAANLLIESGNTRNKTYKLNIIESWKKKFTITSSLKEDVVWRNDIASVINNIPKNVFEIWDYGFTEMFNNAIDHSSGSEITVIIEKTAIDIRMFVIDNGVGIFKKIQTELNLLDQRHAVLELTKGKLSTAPKNHSGQGIFFSSKMFDHYSIASDYIYFGHEYNDSKYYILEKDQVAHGTSVVMQINNNSKRTMKKIFDQYSGNKDEDYEFNKTVVPVKLAQYGNDQLISRSQAKRLLTRIEKFKIVIFDFSNVDMIGQAFADEIFRVFVLKHPEIKLLSTNTNTTVMKMINRAKKTKL